MPVIHIICQAIDERRVLSFIYKASVRTAEPYILGYEQHGHLTLSAVQRTGGSGIGFRTFPIDGISALKVTEKKFSGTHPEYNPRDRFFARIICKV